MLRRATGLGIVLLLYLHGLEIWLTGLGKDVTNDRRRKAVLIETAIVLTASSAGRLGDTCVALSLARDPEATVRIDRTERTRSVRAKGKFKLYAWFYMRVSRLVPVRIAGTGRSVAPPP